MLRLCIPSEETTSVFGTGGNHFHVEPYTVNVFCASGCSLRNRLAVTKFNEFLIYEVFTGASLRSTLWDGAVGIPIYLPRVNRDTGTNEGIQRNRISDDATACNVRNDERACFPDDAYEGVAEDAELLQFG